MLYRYLFFFFLLLLTTTLPAQTPDLQLEAFNQAHLDHQRRAMYALGGWAAVNIAGGLYLRGRTSGETRRFHEMNALWNTVNLAIAGVGYYGVMTSDPGSWDVAESLRQQQNFQKILLLNAGIDVGYVLGGLYLTERAKRPDADADQLRGYGKAVMLQGGFLFAFDLVNYWISSRRAWPGLELGPTSEGVGLLLTF